LPITAHPLWQRFRAVAWLGACFLAICRLTRVAVLVSTGHGVPATPAAGAPGVAIGLGYRLVAA
jgi:hypothetical protein